MTFTDLFNTLISPQMIDLILVLVIGEFLVAALWLRRAGRLALALPLFWFLLSGAMLLLAVRAALMPDPAGWAIGAALIGGLITHLACLSAAWAASRRK